MEVTRFLFLFLFLCPPATCAASLVSRLGHFRLSYFRTDVGLQHILDAIS